MKALWTYADCLNEAEVKRALDLIDKEKYVEPTITTAGVVDKKIRDSKIKWLRRADPKLVWLFEKIDNQMYALNRNWHGIDVFPNNAYDSIQYTEYNVGHYYTAHVDSFFNAGDMMTRKLSSSVLLSDPKEFDGGDLLIESGRMDPEKVKMGQMICFPSLLRHEVLPITRGTRKSLVVWCTGPSWV